MGQEWWSKKLEIIYGDVESSPKGLASKEALKRLKHYGPNVLDLVRKRVLLLQFLSRFRNPLVLLLLAASLISAFTAEVTSFVIIISMVVISVTLDFIQEYRAEQAAETLRHSVALKANVLRDQQAVEIHVDLLVPGDVVLLSAGDLVPADGRVIEAHDLFVNQALLTGEPYPVEKFALDTVDVEAGLENATNVAFAGTSIVSGSGRVLSCQTGGKTALGEIAG